MNETPQPCRLRGIFVCKKSQQHSYELLKYFNFGNFMLSNFNKYIIFISNNNAFFFILFNGWNIVNNATFNRTTI